MAALLAVVAAQFFDFASFAAMTARHGLSAEANPLVVALAQYGTPALALGKASLALYLVAGAVVLRAGHPGVARLLVISGILAGIVGGLSNVASL
ncbi:MAG TPA: hypothetical protein VFK38_04300 [Candidatus Limnocylindrales bacterium]|nr:hypothetical protein [Candidatus Limnocylindrales bacterium]